VGPDTVAGMHRILLRTICFDFIPEAHEAGLAFWREALATSATRGTHYPEYHILDHPAALGPVFVQQIEHGASRIHLDIESDDVPAEVARLTKAGASVVAEHQSDTVGDWTVLRDPAGLLFCVVSAHDQGFGARALTVGG
jgi:predicted enzyme related to lactoylglutathione lyase